MPTRQRPRGLGAEGVKLWKSIASEYDLRADELRVLEDACRLADVIAQLRQPWRVSNWWRRAVVAGRC